MNAIYTRTVSALFAVAMTATVPAHAAEMGDVDEPIKLAVNEWTGQHITTHVAGQILERAGYKIEYIIAGYNPQFTALEDGTIHASLELWTSNVPDLWIEKRDQGSVVDIGGLGLDAGEGIAYPKHVEEICPGLPDWQALKDCGEAFATAETLPDGRLVDYPADWGSPGADRMAALGLPFTAVPAGSEGALVSEIKASVVKKSPLLLVFWRPHWLLAEVDLGWVALPKGEQACYDDPSWGLNPDATFDCDFIETHIFKVVWSGFQEKWPAAYEILEAYQLRAEDQQPLMGSIDNENQDIETVIGIWVDENEAIWRPWVDAAVN